MPGFRNLPDRIGSPIYRGYRGGKRPFRTAGSRGGTGKKVPCQGNGIDPQGYCYLNDALEKGFLQNRFADKMEFFIDWCNEGHCTEFKILDFSFPSLEGFIRTLCERYFITKNYLRVEGKPVVIIHVPSKIANAHGGWEGCKKALDRMREIAREYGHPGVYFVALQNNKPFLPDYAKGGFDCVTAYAYDMRDVPWDPQTRSMPFEPLFPRHKECFAIARKEAHNQGLDYIPSSWVGWDDNARSKENAVRTTGNAPSAFRRMIEMLPEYDEGNEDRGGKSVSRSNDGRSHVFKPAFDENACGKYLFP
jgi:hypothetical protein